MNGFSRHLSRFWYGWLLIAAVVVLALATLRANTSAKRGDVASRENDSMPADPQSGVSPARPRRAEAGGSTGDPVRDAMERAAAMEQSLMEKGEKNQRYWQEGFAAQRVNPAWARPKENEILRLVKSGQFQATDAKPSDLKVQCRSSLCRITADFPSSVAAQDWSEFFTLYSANRFSGGITRQETLADGNIRLVVITASRD